MSTPQLQMPETGIQKLTEIVVTAFNGLFIIELVVIAVVFVMAMKGRNRESMDATLGALQVPAMVCWGIWILYSIKN